MMNNQNVKYMSDVLRKDLKSKRVVELEISMAECAEKIGISKPTLCRVEKGFTPDLFTFFKIVKFLKKEPKEYIKY